MSSTDQLRAERSGRALSEGWVECASALIELAQRHPDLDMVDPPPADTMRVRRALHDYVGTLRCAGTPPEAAVIAIKRLVNEVGLQIRRDARVLMTPAVSWAIEAYYAV